jgi:hypothetical protein
MIVINTSPGNVVSIVIQTVDGYGSRLDGYQAPTLDSILNPNSIDILGTTHTMSRLSTGLYKRSVTMPSSSSSIGTYIATVSWPHPTYFYIQYETYVIQVSMPFGNSSVSPA